MAVMALVGIASLGAVFMVMFLVAITPHRKHYEPYVEDSFLAPECNPTSGLRLVPSTFPNKTYRMPVTTPACATRRRSPAAEQEQRIQAR